MTFERETLSGVEVTTAEQYTDPKTGMYAYRTVRVPANVIERHALAEAAAEADPKLAQTRPRQAINAVVEADPNGGPTAQLLDVRNGGEEWVRWYRIPAPGPITERMKRFDKHPCGAKLDLGESDPYSHRRKNVKVVLPPALTEYLADIERLTVEAGKRIESERAAYAKTKPGQLDAALERLEYLSHRGVISNDVVKLIDTAIRLAVEIAVEEAAKAAKE